MSGIPVSSVASLKRAVLHPHTGNQKSEEETPSKKPRQESTTAPKPTVTDPNDPRFYNDDISPEAVPLALLPQLIGFVNSSEVGKQLQGATLIRKMLCVAAGIKDDQEGNPSDAVMASGVVPRLLALLRCDERPELQSECSWALTNLCAGPHLPIVVELGVVPHFVRLLDSPSDAVREQAACGVNRIASANSAMRDLVLTEGSMQPLLRCASSSTLSVARNGVKAVSTLCRGKPSPKLDDVAVALPVLVPLLAHPDEDVVTNACWGVSDVADGNADRVQWVLNAGALPQIVNLLGSGIDSHVTPAVVTLGNVAAGSTEQVEQLVSDGALPLFHHLLKHPRRTVRKDACWTLTNVIADTTDMIQAVIDAELFPLVIECMDAVEDDVAKVALWCVANICTGGTSAQIRHLVEDLFVIRHLIPLLSRSNARIVTIALDSVDHILVTGADITSRDALVENPYAKLFADCGGLERLRSLSEHPDRHVADHATAVLESEYFSNDGTEDAG